MAYLASSLGARNLRMAQDEKNRRRTAGLDNVIRYQELKKTLNKKTGRAYLCTGDVWQAYKIVGVKAIAVRIAAYLGIDWQTFLKFKLVSETNVLFQAQQWVRGGKKNLLRVV